MPFSYAPTLCYRDSKMKRKLEVAVNPYVFPIGFIAM